MTRPRVEVADVFRQHGPAYRQRHALAREPLRLMRAIETCRTAELGGHVERCGHCHYQRISYNSCRNRHCPKCGSLARARWLEQRKADLLPVQYFHVVFTLPQPLATIAYHNQEVVYGLLFRTAAETLLTLGRDPKHLGAELGFFSILHTWGQNLLYHPHLHCVVAGGGISADQQHWIGCRPGFFLPVRVLSRLFRRLFLTALRQAYDRGQLHFFSELKSLIEPPAFAQYLDPLFRAEWVVYAKPPFGGPQQVIEYLGRYTHRVAISNQRLVSLSQGRVTFCWKDYRRPDQHKRMTLEADEFIRRFLLHSLPPGFQRIRHYGFLSNRHRRTQVALCRRLLALPCADLLPSPADFRDLYQALTGQDLRRCPRCGSGVMVRIEILQPAWIRWPDSS